MNNIINFNIVLQENIVTEILIIVRSFEMHSNFFFSLYITIFTLQGEILTPKIQNLVILVQHKEK